MATKFECSVCLLHLELFQQKRKMIRTLGILLGVVSVVQSYPIGRNGRHSAQFTEGGLNVAYDIAMDGDEKSSAKLSKSGRILENISNVRNGLASDLIRRSKRGFSDDFFAQQEDDAAWPSDLLEDFTMPPYKPRTDYEVLTLREVLQIREDAEGHVIGREHKE
ncbi:hypothetical protein CAPTEDRAFT_198837 [Capitella teleta]|uniref:Uncharacterized protein n=1 Tax=Capitella teleta TaxID=283909 RepID=R7T3S2_CAPTE|nr:hypothetical protein CAPTEDRAFT_198837 [Capitella teleta]|eukprot:ELT87462.1 hypothetical protein CAPTEDRAFT_198837 [Capitella teleta]